ncbi:hypothetical protein BWD42_04390 [Sphingobacterium sp. CZ-UAM]|uniref:HesA/MoeB/ThiF family protein n=1 Tax=Sphingobacterium sp. CZ-UAM TaxID=1933868 RepID=UPI000984DACE|nr:HesA/MoeB/ThiF family protein [Sphingobacterium sp. CZ-UAM]OOG19192.1 hypothetical protein BWD42_04390 [Sphingobacterium sp. CZ-UAM]
MQHERYARQYVLQGFGEAGQQKLQAARLLVVGAGGLGCPVLQYLVAAGVGHIAIIDHDRIELSNLHRQVLYDTADIGLPKAEVAARKLQQLNPECDIQYWVEQFSPANAVERLQSYDIILDCTDNFAARYLLCDACRLLDKPLIFAAIYQYEGQVAVFNVADTHGVKTSYRHLFPLPPDPLEAPDCNTAGVLGVLPGMIGILQATEAIKLLTGIGVVLINKLVTVNLLDHSTFTFDIPPALPESSSYPQSLDALKDFDYFNSCASTTGQIQVITAADLVMQWHAADLQLVDVREMDELPRLPVPHLSIPLATLPQRLEQLNRRRIVFVCQTGKRSLAAAQYYLGQASGKQQIFHVDGGIMVLKNYFNE